MLFLVAGLLAIWLCASIVLASDKYTPLEIFGFDGFEPSVSTEKSKGDAVLEFYRRFGYPQEIACHIRYDREPDVMTEEKTWRYKDMEVTFVGDAESPKRVAQMLTLTDSRYSLKYGLAIGKTKEEFIAVLGMPLIKNSENIFQYDSEYIWNVGDVLIRSNNTLSIYFNDEDKVEKIVWEYYGD